jgi:periplasmic protein TonB
MHRQSHIALLDDPWQRFPLVLIAAILLWGAVLVGFGLLLRLQATNISPEPLEVQIVEGPAGEFGSRGSGAPAGNRKISASPKSTEPTVEKPSRRKSRISRVRSSPAPREDPVAKPETQTTDTHVPAAPTLTAPPPGLSSSAAARSAAFPAGDKGVGGRGGSGNGVETGTAVGSGVIPSSGTGIGGGYASGGTGPTAIYAPAPTIPDDMRDEVLEAVAVAHFRVLHDGRVIVSLPKPTDFSRLNDIILDTLREWRFRPAMNKGVAVDSEAEVRLLITVH